MAPRLPPRWCACNQYRVSRGSGRPAGTRCSPPGRQHRSQGQPRRSGATLGVEVGPCQLPTHSRARRFAHYGVIGSPARYAGNSTSATLLARAGRLCAGCRCVPRRRRVRSARAGAERDCSATRISVYSRASRAGEAKAYCYMPSALSTHRCAPDGAATGLQRLRARPAPAALPSPARC